MSGALVIRPAPESRMPANADWRRPAWIGFAVIFVAFGVCGVWAATAVVDGAIVAPGVVSIETNSKVVEHYEGGIIGEILVREGERVQQGQVLFRLNAIQAKASLDTYRNQLMTARVYEARLTAERDNKPTITLPPDIAAMASDEAVAKAVADQQAQFDDRRNSRQVQIDILNSRIEGSNREIQGLQIEQSSTTTQVGYINQELVGLRELRASNLIPLDRLLSMERERTRLDGNVGRAIVDQSRARNSIGETRMQIQEIEHKFQEDTAGAIADVRQKINDLQEKQRVAQDVMHRIDIRAPVDGTLQNLKVNGLGQVIRSGEPLAEIVPDDEKLIVRSHFSPNDIAHVHTEQAAEVRFPSFHSRTVPVILGHLASVSKDRLVDEATHEPYYLGLVAVSKLDIPEDLRGRLRAGMPAEVIVSSGSRTVLGYLTSPLTEAWRTSFRDP
jgi:HlyD family secretion protein